MDTKHRTAFLRQQSYLFSNITAVVASMAGIKLQPGDIVVSYLFILYTFSGS